MKIAIVVAMLLGAGRANALDAWTNTNTGLQVTFTAVGLLDIALTDSIIRTDGFAQTKERNPVLGKAPSSAKLWGWGCFGLVSHAVVARLLPERPRVLWQTMGITAEIAVSAGNASIVFGGRL